MQQQPQSLWPHPPDRPPYVRDPWWRRVWLATHTAPNPPGAPPGRHTAPWRIVGSASAALLSLCTICSCGLVFAAAMSPRPPGTVTILVTPTATATPQPTPRPTVKPKPTAKPVPGPVTTASLGGTQDAFTAAFGDPTLYGSTPNYAVTISGTAVAVSLDDLETGSDGQQRVDQMSIDPADPSAWDDTLAAAVTARFIPRDAHYVRDITDPTVGTIHVYQSVDLARSFPASSFTDSGNGGTLPPGTLGVACDNPAQTGCTITVGT